MAEREVIREFLAKLGFSVDVPSFRTWVGWLKKGTVSANALTASILGIVVAIEALVYAFARQMERLYYASIRTRATVGEIQGLEFALGQVGVEAEAARALLETLGANIRTNPATTGLLRMFGVVSEGKKQTEVVLDLLEKLSTRFKGRQYQIGARFAERLLGIDERTYFQLTRNLPEIRRAMAERERMNREAGVDPEEQAKKAREFMNELRALWTKVTILGGKFAEEMMPVLKEINGLADRVITIMNWMSGTVVGKVLAGATKYAASGILGQAFGGQDLMSDLARSALDAMRGPPDKRPTPPAGAVSGQITRQPSVEGFPREQPNEALEAARRSLILLRDEQRTSPDPARQYEINRVESLIGRLSGGPSVPSGITAPGAAARADGSKTLNVVVNSAVNVTGARDPEGTAGAIGRIQERVFGDTVRNMEGVVQ